MTIKQAIKKYPNDADLGDFVRNNFTELEFSGFSEYQNFVNSTKVYPEKHSIVYPALGLAGEAGEVAEKIKKWLRGDRELDVDEVIKEMGDILWYISSMATDLGRPLNDVVIENIVKLSSRKERKVIQGEGDNR